MGQEPINPAVESAVAAEPVRAKRPGADVIDLTTFSNGIRLSVREWIGVGIFGLLMFLAAPSLWKQAEPFALEPDYRMPYDLSNDYWLYERYAQLAGSQYDTLLVGDSVIWGQYVTRQQTLSHYLNALAGKERFANLGLDGAHPLALSGLMEHYTDSISAKNILVQCNPLWMSSRKHDLQVEEEFRFNHPRLVQQFWPQIPCYKEEVSPRLGIVVEQRVPFNGWVNHVQQAYFDRTDIPAWTLERPYDNPLKQLGRGLPPSDNLLRHEPVSWTQRGIKPQDFPWVDPDTSLQWRAFQCTVKSLQQRGNHVFVLLGPFNEHLLSADSLRRYQNLQRAIEAWLQANQVEYGAPAALPSEHYADASHPLAVGYAELARELANHAFFGLCH
jgi:hypothetical protein